MAVVREIEHKFRVHGLYRIPNLQEIEGVARVDDRGVVELNAIYYDTADLRLVRDGVTLRRREGGDDAGWHLKLPTGATGVRDEVQIPCEDESSEPPQRLVDVVTVLTRRAPLTAVAALRTRRHRWRLLNAADETVGELVDDHVAALSESDTVTARFRELELETYRDADTVSRVLDALRTAGASEGAFVAKVVRALGPEAADDPEVAPPPELRASDPAHVCIAAYFAIQVRSLRRHDVAFRLEPQEPGDHVHQMRVAARRLRSGLRAFGPVLDQEWANDLSNELRWFARALTRVRETEVLLPRLLADAGELPPDLPANQIIGRIHGALDGQLSDARHDALRLITTDRYVQLHDRLVAAARGPHVTDDGHLLAAEIFQPLVHTAWRKLKRAATDLRIDSPDAQWHKVRLAAKRARYTGEAVAPALGRSAAKFARRVERLTDILGEHQDAVQAAEQAHNIAEGTADDVRFGLGAIAGAERVKAQAARAKFARALRGVTKP